MSYCREGHTLIDNEAEAGWERLPPGSFFELVVLAVTYFGIVDEYIPPTPTTLVCRLFTDSGRTILHTVDIGLGSVYEINEGVDYLHDQLDLQLNSDGGMGIWRSPTVTIRDDTGVWGGEWVAEPKPDELVQFNFDGTHTLFKVSVESPLATEVAGAGLGAGTFQYCIVPVDGSGRLGAGSRVLTVTLAGAADILIDWLPNTQVTEWNVYGRVSGALFGLMTTLPGATVSLLDDGVLVPDPNFQPPLFEDPAWTVAIANREQSGTDGDVVFVAEGIEDGVTKNDDGSSVATFTAVGDVDADNTAEATKFLLTGLVSHSNGRLDIVVDPTLFSNDTGPVESLPPKVTTYDYHVFIDDNGDTVIQEADSFTGQTTVIIVNTVDNTFDITISDSTGVLATDSVTITPAFTIPTPGSMSAEITLNNFRTLGDGTIIADETITANTYDVTPVINPGIMFLTSQNFGNTTNGELAYSFDGAATWASYDIPSTRLIPPAGFSINRKIFTRAHGEGWTVVALLDIAAFPSSVADYSMHWTNDLTAIPWPFNDAMGRVASGSISASELDILKRFLDGNNASSTIRKFANGLVAMSRDFSTDANWGGRSFGDFDIDFFFPTTGVFTFQDPGLTKYKHNTFWKEKNLLIGLEDGAIGSIWVNPVVNNQTTPLGAQDFKHIIGPAAVTEVLALGTSRDMAYVTWRAGGSVGWSFSFDGSNWTDVTLNLISDVDFRNPGNEPIGLNPGDASDPSRNGELMWLRDTATLAISRDNGASWSNTPAKAASTFNAWGYEPFISSTSGELDFLKVPMFSDGITFGMDNPNTFLTPGGQFYRMDPDDFSDAAPTPGAAFGIGGGDTTDVSWLVGTTKGSAASPNGIPGANLRRYLGRSVVIPTGVANMPAPFVIRDTTASAVYTSSRTKTREVNYGGMRGTITEGPGGLGAIAVGVIESGQQIIINVPNSSSAVMAAKNPIPVNMRWTSII